MGRVFGNEPLSVCSRANHRGFQISRQLHDIQTAPARCRNRNDSKLGNHEYQASPSLSSSEGFLDTAWIRKPNAVVNPPKIVPNRPINAALGSGGSSRTIKTVAITTAEISARDKKNRVRVLMIRIRSDMAHFMISGWLRHRQADHLLLCESGRIQGDWPLPVAPVLQLIPPRMLQVIYLLLQW